METKNVVETVETADAPGGSPWLEFLDTDSRGQKVTKRARPLGDRIIIRPWQRKQVQIGGLIIAQAVREEMPVEGVVVSIGPDIHPGSIEVGDVVIYGSDDGVALKLGLDATDYIVVADEHIVALLSKASDMQERDRFSRISVVRNNWVLLEWEQALDEIKLAGGLTLGRAQTWKAAHYTGIVRMVGPDASGEVKEAVGERVFFDRWAHEFREKCWYEAPADGQPQKRFAFILDHRLNCVVPPRAKVTVSGHEFVPDDGPGFEKIEVDVKPGLGRVYG